MLSTTASVGAMIAWIALTLLCIAPSVRGDFVIKYCSPDNTGVDNGERRWNWQSNGYCHDQCAADYAFAIVQFQGCWCSNYIPRNQVDTGSCGDPCPGFPNEKCGNQNKDLYGYIALNKRPSGTQGVSSTAGSAASSTTLKTATSNTSAPGSNASPSIPVVVTTTINGQTVVTTVPPTTVPVNKGTDVKTIVGGTIGGIAGLAMLIGGMVFGLLRYRRRQHEMEETGIQRNASTMSRSGLLKPGADATITGGISPSSPYGTDAITPMSRHRDSGMLKPIVTHHGNSSRASVNTLNDGEDYSRPLKVRNPDPEPDV